MIFTIFCILVIVYSYKQQQDISFIIDIVIMNSTMAATNAHSLNNTADVNTNRNTNRSNNNQFDDWMFKQGGKLQNGSGSESVTTTDSSSWSWFEPLENIISSASSSSIGSPIEDQGVSANTNANIFGNSTTLFTDPSSYTNSPDLLAVVKKEETEEDELMKNNDKSSVDVKLLPDFDSLANLQDSTLASTANGGKKKRAPRKRLTSHQKQAHNKIEKRYRININTKIAKLQQIIPWVASEQTAFEVGDSLKKQNSFSSKSITCSNSPTNETPISAASSTKLNKSMILEKAVDYILYLQNSERLYEMEVKRLKDEVDSLKRSSQ